MALSRGATEHEALVEAIKPNKCDWIFETGNSEGNDFCVLKVRCGQTGSGCSNRCKSTRRAARWQIGAYGVKMFPMISLRMLRMAETEAIGRSHWLNSAGPVSMNCTSKN